MLDDALFEEIVMKLLAFFDVFEVNVSSSIGINFESLIIAIV